MLQTLGSLIQTNCECWETSGDARRARGLGARRRSAFRELPIAARCMRMHPKLHRNADQNRSHGENRIFGLRIGFWITLYLRPLRASTMLHNTREHTGRVQKCCSYEALTISINLAITPPRLTAVPMKSCSLQAGAPKSKKSVDQTSGLCTLHDCMSI